MYGTECEVVNGRRPEEGLIAGEQGGFRKMRGCRDQILSLVLLGQMEMLMKLSGLMAAFIDFFKTYDRIHRGKLWKCLECEWQVPVFSPIALCWYIMLGQSW